ncbi:MULTISPECIES: hypothetical protein [unclassified Streptosporangium]|uniref:hypothetical protein n=1 Tax=unclassified Streptosporangium TaxID=2632669 RepID=UPI002E2A9C58|nr:MULTISPECIES: hypothetical protein [unclassified Streptosporangium]
MSFEEKRVWIYAAIAIGVPVVYVVTILGRVREAGVAEVAYVWPMITAIGVAMVVNMVANMVAGMVSPKEMGKDERDGEIYRHGMRAEFHVLAVGGAAALGLTMAEFEHFWIANALYLAFVLSALSSSIVKIVAYRRGF